MKKSFVYKLTFNRPHATGYIWYFTMPPTTAVVLEAIAVEYLADLQTLSPDQTDRAKSLRLWHDNMVEEIDQCGVPDVGPSVGTTTRTFYKEMYGTTEISVEKMGAFV